MLKRLIFLTGEFDARGLVGLFNRIAPDCAVTWVRTRDELDVVVSDDLSSTRLVSFCSGVIVPAAVLSRLRRPAYNIHPGPPTYPGCHPECWGAYEGARRFGATLHVMEPRVDEGRIIDTRWFDLPENAGQRAIARQAFEAAVELILRWASPLVADADLSPNGEMWSGRKWRRADQEPLRNIPLGIDADEFARRCRAFAEIPGSALHIDLFGKRFAFVAPLENESG